jgi:hypothetical protein
MGKPIKQKHGGVLVRPDKGETANRRGRPRKFVSKLRDTGYSMSEVLDCIQVMLAMTETELESVFENQDATILEITIGKALRKSIERGSLYSIDCLLNRAYGKPKETTSVNADVTMHTIKLG